MTARGRTVAIILAAGAASRFGSPKSLASLDGRPLLQHVLDVAAGLGLAGSVLVLGHEADAIESAVDARAAIPVRNPDPDAGLASSLRVGLAAASRHHPTAQAALVLLGDQPLVRPAVIDALLSARVPAGRSIVVPAYGSGGGPNPALLLRSAWPIAAGLHGDRGMGPVIGAHPELVVAVPVDGDNPDVDTPAELASLAARIDAPGPADLAIGADARRGDAPGPADLATRAGGQGPGDAAGASDAPGRAQAPGAADPR